MNDYVYVCVRCMARHICISRIAALLNMHTMCDGRPALVCLLQRCFLFSLSESLFFLFILSIRVVHLADEFHNMERGMPVCGMFG